MSGKILIVDELATNRIALKVKLATARHQVLQAASGRAALALARQQAPDLVLASARLADLPGPALVRALRRHADGCDALPVVLIQPGHDAEERLAALRAGADDVLVRPLQDTLLLSRLRNLLRQRHADHDLDIHGSTAQALGFADAQHGFLPSGRIALVGPNTSAALALRRQMAPWQGHDVAVLAAHDAMTWTPGAAVPDVFVLQIAPDDTEEGLRLIADLQAARRTRHCPIMALLEGQNAPLAATLLDMGCNIVLTGRFDPRELRLRLDHLMMRKHRSDRLRNQVQSGLRAAVIDPLTGTHNRRYALPFLARLIDDAAHTGRSFAVMVADLDHFKRVNDRYGHAAGDAVLGRVADRLRAGLHEQDLLARIGGEEFLIVLPDTDRDSARQTASRLRDTVQQTCIQLPHRTDSLRVTVSIGVTLARPQPGPGLPTAEALLDQADRALYRAKTDGRNTVTFSARPAA